MVRKPPTIVPVPLKPRRTRVPRRKVARPPRPRKTPQEREARRQQVHAEEREDTHRLWDLAERLGTKLLEPEALSTLALIAGGAIGGLPMGFDLLNIVAVQRPQSGQLGSNPPEVFDVRLTVRAYVLATAALPDVRVQIPAIIPGGGTGELHADLPAWFSPTFRMDETITVSFAEWRDSGLGTTLAEHRAFEAAKAKLRTLLPLVGAGMLPAVTIAGPKVMKSIASFTAGVIPG